MKPADYRKAVLMLDLVRTICVETLAEIADHDPVYA